MRLARLTSDLFAMDEDAWQRHANPVSGWTRLPILPLFALAVWSRVWIGWWCLVPIAILAFWTWLNPRIFPAPRSTENWMSRAVLGERVLLNHDKIRVPHHHRKTARILTILALAGLPILAWGLWRLQVWPTLFGVSIIMALKMWFLDRMVWLFTEMSEANAAYRVWRR